MSKYENPKQDDLEEESTNLIKSLGQSCEKAADGFEHLHFVF
jgi:hypothetical protein